MRRWLREWLCRHRDVLPDTIRFEDGSTVKVLRCQHCYLVREKPFATDIRRKVTPDKRFKLSERENRKLRWTGLVQVRQWTPSANIVKARRSA